MCGGRIDNFNARLYSLWHPQHTALMKALGFIREISDPTITKYHASGFSGEFSSIVIGSDNLPLISYYDEGDNRAIKVMHCLNTACTSAIISTVDIVPSDVSRPNSTSITISDDGLGLVAYAIQQGVDKTPTLKVAHCENLDCSNVTVSELDSFPGGTTSNPVIATGSDGLGLIAYTDSQGNVR